MLLELLKKFNPFIKKNIFIPTKIDEVFTDEYYIEKANDAALKRFEELKISKGIEKNNLLCLDKVKEVKEEFDLIFISFLDKSLSRLIGYSNCTIKHEDRILYSLHIRYKMDSTDLEYMTKTLSEVSEDMFDIESYNKYIKSKYQESEPSSSVILKDGTLVLYIELRSDIKYITTIERNRRTYPDGSVSYGHRTPFGSNVRVDEDGIWTGPYKFFIYIHFCFNKIIRFFI
jgi:hypothetical protein